LLSTWGSPSDPLLRACRSDLEFGLILSSNYLTLHPAERRDFLLFHVDSGLFLGWLMTLNQTDLPPYKFHGSYLSGSEVRTADADRVKNFRRVATASVQEAKPPRYNITEEQRGTLKNLKQDKSMVVDMADSGISIVLLDTDPYHAMKTPLIEIARSQFIKGDQTHHMSY
ncbi:hypothetical protein P5673_020446, partial [Acropora cervicornis]